MEKRVCIDFEKDPYLLRISFYLLEKNGYKFIDGAKRTSEKVLRELLKDHAYEDYNLMLGTGYVYWVEKKELCVEVIERPLYTLITDDILPGALVPMPRDLIIHLLRKQAFLKGSISLDYFTNSEKITNLFSWEATDEGYDFWKKVFLDKDWKYYLSKKQSKEPREYLIIRDAMDLESKLLLLYKDTGECFQLGNNMLSTEIDNNVFLVDRNEQCLIKTNFIKTWTVPYRSPLLLIKFKTPADYGYEMTNLKAARHILGYSMYNKGILISKDSGTGIIIDRRKKEYKEVELSEIKEGDYKEVTLEELMYTYEPRGDLKGLSRHLILEVLKRSLKEVVTIGNILRGFEANIKYYSFDWAKSKEGIEFWANILNEKRLEKAYKFLNLPEKYIDVKNKSLIQNLIDSRGYRFCKFTKESEEEGYYLVDEKNKILFWEKEKLSVWKEFTDNSSNDNYDIKEINKLQEIDWANIVRSNILEEKFIEKYKDFLDWNEVSIYQILSESFIEKYKNLVNWENISKFQQLSESFIEKHRYFVNWKSISEYQILSEKFMDKYSRDIDWEIAYEYQPFVNPMSVSKESSLKEIYDKHNKLGQLYQKTKDQGWFIGYTSGHSGFCGQFSLCPTKNFDTKSKILWKDVRCGKFLFCSYYEVLLPKENDRLENNESLNSVNKTTEQLTIKKEKKIMKTNSMFNGIIEKFKKMYIPEVDNNISISMDGNLCVKRADGEVVAITPDNELISYPEEMCMSLPGIAIMKPVSQVQIGDIIKIKESYSKVLEIKPDGTLKVLGYNGVISNKRTIKDFIINNNCVNVILNYGQNLMVAGNSGMTMNPMILMLLNDNSEENAEDNDDMLEKLILIQMMSGQNPMAGGNGMMMNPMMFMLMDKDKSSGNKKSTLQTMMMMQMMSGQNNGMFGNMMGMGGNYTQQFQGAGEKPKTTRTKKQPRAAKKLDIVEDEKTGEE